MRVCLFLTFDLSQWVCVCFTFPDEQRRCVCSRLQLMCSDSPAGGDGACALQQRGGEGRLRRGGGERGGIRILQWKENVAFSYRREIEK